MINDEQDLWPDFDDTPIIRSPRSIMAEQAAILSKKTKNILTATVNTVSTGDGKIVDRFYIDAPLLKNYSYLLFSVYHGAIYYPCVIIFNSNSTNITNEQALLDTMRDIFNDNSTKSVIVSLLGQSKEQDLSF